MYRDHRDLVPAFDPAFLRPKAAKVRNDADIQMLHASLAHDFVDHLVPAGQGYDHFVGELGTGGRGQIVQTAQNAKGASGPIVKKSAYHAALLGMPAEILSDGFAFAARANDQNIHWPGRFSPALLLHTPRDDEQHIVQGGPGEEPGDGEEIQAE
jgi:hypothetical protein